MAVNKRLMLQTLDYINTHPEEWNQGEWREKKGDSSRCKTAMCFAGHAATIDGGKWVSNNPKSEVLEFLVPEPDEPNVQNVHMRKNDTYVQIRAVKTENRARRILGLSSEQALTLFDASNTMEKLEELVYEYTS